MAEEKLKIFIVHGHDEAPKEALAKIIEKEGFEAVILNEKLNEEMTIIEKLERYTDVTYAFVIYTACDKGKSKDGILESRARQNVIFEHGFLMGKLGRENTTVLYEEGIVEPSDIKGLGYTPLNEAWKYEVERILKKIKENPNRKETKNEKQNINPEISAKKNEIKYESFRDIRDDRTYKTIKIGNQVWMAEDLKYESNSNDSAATYYWSKAMEACPPGWHLPTYEEWMELVNFAGGIGIAGEKLKAKRGWGRNCFCNGTDDYGFSALPCNNEYKKIWQVWGVSKNDLEPLCIAIKSDNNIDTEKKPKRGALSVRCVKDVE